MILDRRTTAFLAYFVRQYPRRTALLVGLLILSGLAEGIGVLTILPLLDLAGASAGEPDSGIGRAVAGAVEAIGLPPTFEVYLVLIVAGMFLKGAFLLLAMKQVGYTVSRVGTDLRLSLIRAILQARWAHFTNQPAGAFANALGVETNQAGLAYRHACSLLAALIQVVVYLLVALLISWKVAAFALLAGGTAMLLLSRLIALTRGAARRKTGLMRALAVRITEALHGMKALKAVGRERRLIPVLENEVQAINREQERAVMAAESLRAAQEPLLALMLAVLLYFALTWGDQPLSALLMFGFVFYRLATYIGLTQTFYQQVTAGESAFWSLRETIVRAERAREQSRRTGVRPVFEREIRFENVSFGYDGVPVLSDANLRVGAGQLVVLTGPSGAGKTTVIDLLAGLYEPDSGRILVDGEPLQRMDLEEWRDMIGYVPQEMFLFNDSVFNNVALGDPRVSPDVARRALEAAAAWEFVGPLPEGMNTVVGERGGALSGGQRQRIAVARELARSPRLLFLDEITTSLDPAAERLLCETLGALRGAVTMVAISHQPLLAGIADVVFRVEGGGISEVARRDTPDHALSTR